jgi:hypothetical protein
MSKIVKILPFYFLLLYLSSCTDSSKPIGEDSSKGESTLIETNNSEAVELINFSNEDIARFAISSIMGTPSKKIKVRYENGIYYLSYIRKSDSTKWENRVKIEGREIFWASLEGRWRISKDDEKISFEEIGSKLKITQVFSDGGVVIKEFKKGD